MTDYISRSSAIEQIKEEWAKLPLSETTGFAILMRVLTKMPAADVREVKSGKWKRGAYTDVSPKDMEFYYCSECGHRLQTFRTHYCPNCGAQMEEQT